MLRACFAEGLLERRYFGPELNDIGILITVLRLENGELRLEGGKGRLRGRPSRLSCGRWDSHTALLRPGKAAIQIHLPFLETGLGRCRLREFTLKRSERFQVNVQILRETALELVLERLDLARFCIKFSLAFNQLIVQELGRRAGLLLLFVEVPLDKQMRQVRSDLLSDHRIRIRKRYPHRAPAGPIPLVLGCKIEIHLGSHLGRNLAQTVAAHAPPRIKPVMFNYVRETGGIQHFLLQPQRTTLEIDSRRGAGGNLSRQLGRPYCNNNYRFVSAREQNGGETCER